MAIDVSQIGQVKVTPIAQQQIAPLAPYSGLAVNVPPSQHGDFEVNSAYTRGMISALSRRQREQSGLS